MSLFSNRSNLQYSSNPNYTKELIAGATVAMTMIPESLSFAILARIPPIMGLYAAFIMGIITALFGGRPGLISGGAGATIIVLMGLISQYGVEYLLLTLILAGIIQILVGILKWTKFVTLIPLPVMMGFLNGLAIIIFLAQVEQFKINPTTWMQGKELYSMITLTALSILLVGILPQWLKRIPIAIISILIISLLVHFLNIDTKLVKDISSIKGGLPVFKIPHVPIDFSTLKIVLPFALLMASVGLIETLLTLKIVDEKTNSQGNKEKETIAQGSANILNGFFGGMGGCAMIAQTVVNLEAGGKTKWSAVFNALIILVVILFLAPYIEKIPLAALMGIMMVAAFKTFEWSSFKILRTLPKPDILIGIIVTLIIIYSRNLAFAVILGVIFSALRFTWRQSKNIKIQVEQDEKITRLTIKGPLFYGNIEYLQKHIEQNHERDIILDFQHSNLEDMTAINFIAAIESKYNKTGKIMSIQNLNEGSLKKWEKYKNHSSEN